MHCPGHHRHVDTNACFGTWMSLGLTRRRLGRLTVCLLICLTLWLTVCARMTLVAADRDAPLVRPRLTWRNGDRLDGGVVAMTDTELSWNASLFLQPLRLSLDALHAIQFPIPADGELGAGAIDDTPPQMIETRDGNRFLGKIVAWEPEDVRLQSELFGPVRLRRSAIRLVTVPIHREEIYHGPQGFDGWQTKTYGRRLSEWEEIAGGRLFTRLVAAELFRELPTHGSLDVEVELDWQHNPSFQLRFHTPLAVPTRETITLETRSDQLELQLVGSNGRFQPLGILPKESTKCRLKLQWDHHAQEFTVFLDRKFLGKVNVKPLPPADPAVDADTQTAGAKPAPVNNGANAAEATGAAPTATLPLAGLYIKNTGPQLTVTRVVARADTARLSNNADEQSSPLDELLRADGTSLKGLIQQIDTDAVTLQSGNADTVVVPWPEIVELALRAEEPVVSAPDVASESGTSESGTSESGATKPVGEPGMRFVDCLFRKGEQVRAQLVGADGESIELRLASVRDPIHVPFGKLDRITFHPRTVPPPEGTPCLLTDSMSLHGELAPTATGHLGWRPFGALAASKLDLEERSAAELSDDRSWTSLETDLLYLRSGEVFHGVLERATDLSYTIVASHAGLREIPSHEVKAVEFGMEARPAQFGFDASWTLEHDDRATRHGDSITFASPTTFFSDTALEGVDRVEFDVQHRRSDDPGTMLSIELRGESGEVIHDAHIYFLKDRIFFPGGGRQGFQPKSDLPPEFAIVIETHDPFRVTANGNELFSIPAAPNEPDVRGIEFKVVRFKQPRNFDPDLLNSDVAVTVSNLRRSGTKRVSIAKTIRRVDITPFLMIPRAKRDARITHLAIALNGDIVRGEVVDLDQAQLRMRTMHADVTLPRRSLAGIVHVAPGPATSSDSVRAKLVLHDDTSFGISEPRIAAEQIEGEHPVFGHCSVPQRIVREILLGETPGPLHPLAFMNWRATPAPEPAFTEFGGSSHQILSRLVATQPDDIELSWLDGTPFRLHEQRGRVTVLDFWASWSAPCIRSMPALVEMIGTYEPNRVQLIAVNQGEDLDTVQRILEAKGWTLPVVLDPKARARRTFDVDAVPQTVVLDQDGIVTAVFVGASPALHRELKVAIDELLSSQ